MFFSLTIMQVGDWGIRHGNCAKEGYLLSQLYRWFWYNQWTFVHVRKTVGPVLCSGQITKEWIEWSSIMNKHACRHVLWRQIPTQVNLPSFMLHPEVRVCAYWFPMIDYVLQHRGLVPVPPRSKIRATTIFVWSADTVSLSFTFLLYFSLYSHLTPTVSYFTVWLFFNDISCRYTVCLFDGV